MSATDASVSPKANASVRAAKNVARAAKPVRRPAVRVKAGDAATGGTDRKVIIAGVVILALLGYVGYRTQVCGETLSQVIPFMGGGKPAVAQADESAESGAPASTRSGVVKPAKSSDADNTLFGRRQAAPAR